ncbi:hypothetical protein JCM12178A_03700 [Salidesulfovibrio brasiliensis]
MDLSAYNIPLGVGLILLGIGVTLFALLKQNDAQTFICPRCECVFNREQMSEKKCPSCNAELEPLEGFYERHPEKKDEGQKL